MISAFRARRFVVSCLLSLIAPLPGGAQTISQLTDQVLETHHSSSPGYFVNLTADRVLFMATLPGGNRAPHVTDGSTAGTVPLLPPQPADTIITGGFHVLGSHAYFFTYLTGGSTGSFWKTDGTPGGTILVTDQAPTEIGSIQIVNERIIGIGYGQEYSRNFLWASDGTAQGTGTIHTPPDNASIYSGSAANGSYYFTLTVTTGEGQRDAIWKSDGTAAGTVAVKTLSHDAGGVTTYDHTPEHPTTLDGSVYFLARETVIDDYYGDYHDRSVLWKTDGTSSGTQRLGNFSVLYNRMFAFAGSLFLERSGSVDGNGTVTPPQIRRSNGTIAGSSIIFAGSDPRHYTGMTRIGEYGGHVYFNMVQSNVMYPSSPKFSDLHRMHSDGSFEALGTLPSSWNYSTGEQLSYAYAVARRPSGLYLGTYGGVEDIWRISSASPATIDRLGSGAVASEATIGGYMIGAGNNFTSGREVYSSQSGHTLIADLCPGTASSDAAYSGFQSGTKATLGNTLLYNGQDSVSGTELWRSDGTADGTFRLKDISYGSATSAISSIFPANGFAWFIVQRGDSSPAYSVTELWKTDGTTAGTTFVRRCPASEYWGQYYADDSRIVVKKSPLDGGASSLEILDGPGAGNVIAGGPGFIGPVVLSGGYIWWQESGGSEPILKRSDGSASAAVAVSFPAGHTLETLHIAYDGGVICTTISGNTYRVVWLRPSGSVILHERADYTYFDSFREHGGRLYFVGGDALYASDGTANSAAALHSAYQIGDGAGDGFVSHRGSLYFFSRSSYDGPRTIWKTEGTPATTSATPITLAPGSSNAFMVSTGDWLLYPYEYYDPNSGNTILEARRTSGLTDGEIIPAITSTDLAFHSSQKYLRPLPSGILFFNRHTAESGDELYKLELPAAPPASPFGLWAESHGLSGISALPHEDADRDGTPNLVEFYAGTVPDQLSSSVTPAFSTISPAGTPIRIVSIPRMPGSGLTLVVESSLDMTHWNPDVTIAPDGTHSYSPSARISIHNRSGSSPETITFAVTPANTYPKIFVRFRVAE